MLLHHDGMVLLFAEVQISDSAHSLRSFYSEVEGATKLNLHHSVPLEMCYCMVLLFAEVKFFRFWPKTMDYNKAFWPKLSSFFVVLLLQNGTTTKLKFAPFCSP